MLARDLAWALDPVLFAIEALGFHPDPSQAQPQVGPSSGSF